MSRFNKISTVIITIIVILCAITMLIIAPLNYDKLLPEQSADEHVVGKVVTSVVSITLITVILYTPTIAVSLLSGVSIIVSAKNMKCLNKTVSRTNLALCIASSLLLIGSLIKLILFQSGI